MSEENEDAGDEGSDSNAGEHDIEVFTTPQCPYCAKLKEWLDEEGIEFEEFNVAENREKAVEMIQMTGQRGVPQTIIDGDQAVVGFQPDKIKDIVEG